MFEQEQTGRNINAEIWCAIYCRLSQEDRDKMHELDDSLSIQNQKSMLVSYANSNGWKIYKVYTDDDYTGADRSRPAFNELLRDAENKKFRIVICKSQSRFTRELELVEKYIHGLFPAWGIRFIGLVDNADTENKGNKKARQINGLVNEWYLEDLSENIKGVLTDRREKGFHIGAFAPYGYKKDPDVKGHLLPDEEAAEVVKRIFEMYASGMGRSKIARTLNAEGIPNPTEYKRIHGIRWRRPTDTERGSKWQYFSIGNILENEVYIGNMVQGKYASVSYKTHENKPRPREQWIRVENTHKPIIDRQLWDKVQDIRKARSRHGWDGELGVFARKAKCMYCGYYMRTQKLTCGRKYLGCSSRKIQEDICPGGFIGVQELSETVLAELQKMVREYLDMDEAEKQMVIHNEWRKKINTIEKEILDNRNRLEKVKRTIKTLYQDRVDGIITSVEFKTYSEEFRADEEMYEQKIMDLEDKIVALRIQENEGFSKREILEQSAHIQELNYDIVNTLIEYVEVGKREGHYKQSKVPVIIHWKF